MEHEIDEMYDTYEREYGSYFTDEIDLMYCHSQYEIMLAGEMPIWVEQAVMKVDGVKSARAELTFDPPWDASKMSDEAKLALNMF